MKKLHILSFILIVCMCTYGKGVALVVGLNKVDHNHYAGWSGELVAPENDAKDIAKIAVSQGFDTVVLLTANATTANVINGIIAAASILEEGDVFLLYYSGHGKFKFDRSNTPGDETDRRDETWCLFDGQILDDQINLLFKRFKRFKRGVKILVVSDSCHSGTVVKFLKLPLSFSKADLSYYDPREKGIPYLVQYKTYLNNKPYYDNIECETTVGKLLTAGQEDRYYGLLISACQDWELAYDGEVNSAFTEKLLKVWNNGLYRGGYKDFWKSISALLSQQTPNYYPFGLSTTEFDMLQPFTINKTH